jgi:type IV pilus assembly protein PilY1
LVLVTPAHGDEVPDKIPPHFADTQTAHAPVEVTTTSITEDSIVFQAVSDTDNWTGAILGRKISRGPTDSRPDCADTPSGALCDTKNEPHMSTEDPATFPAPDARTIFTLAEGDDDSDGGPRVFDADVFDELSQVQKEGLTGVEIIGADDQAAAEAAAAAVADDYISWLKGDAVSGLRARGGALMGDMLGSGPLLVGPPAQWFDDPDYDSFKRGRAGRADMLYVGANDGMLHAFKTDTDAASFTEAFAYIPAAVYPALATLADPAYNTAVKESYVDGPLSYSDAKIGGGDDPWRSVLVGSFGMGAQGVFALDITDPESLEATEASAEMLVLWEFTDASGERFTAYEAGGPVTTYTSDDPADDVPDGRYMGHMLAKPAIVRIDSGADGADTTWVALVNNGYGSARVAGEAAAHCNDALDTTNCTVDEAGEAVLYVLRLAGSGADADNQRILSALNTGAGREDDPTGESRANGLSEVAALDVDGDLVADRAYAGDLFGNVWRFDLSSPPAYFDGDADALGGTVRKIFQARDANGNPQPITSRIAFARHPNGGFILLFGTGRLLNAADKDDTSLQSFYGIWDDDGQVHGGLPDRGALIKHQFFGPATVGADGVIGAADTGAGLTLSRRSTAYAEATKPAPSATRGWVIDLAVTDAAGNLNALGERVISAPQVRGGRVVFVSLIPGECCSTGAGSWVNALDAVTGARLQASPFDFNLDGSFDRVDLLGGGTVGSSIRVLGADTESGIYSSPATVALGGSEALSIIADSEGDLIQLRESEGHAWRTWLQIQ